jgi:uncharacterized protein (TIGR03083 family)
VTAAESVPPIRSAEGLLLSRVEYVRFLEVLDTLSEEEWAAPTELPGWDVKAVASHVLGGLECVAVPREFVRQVRAGRRLAREIALPHPNDGLNEVQVREHAPLSGAEVADRIRALVERALRHRGRTPRWLRRAVRPSLDVAGRVPLGWVLDVVYTRDTYLHRVDVCRALGREVVVDDVEERVVADIVREWSARHGKPVTLRLTGPAGGTYECHGGGDEMAYDAVEFTRLVSGRGDKAALPLWTNVQF